MKHMVIAAMAALAFALGGVATAAPPTPSGTIAIGAGSDLNFDGVVTFDTTHSGFKGYQYPLVYLACYQDIDGVPGIDTSFASLDLVYGQLDYPATAFVLGGGSSPWRNTYGGGPAECVARLMVYGDKDDGGPQYVLASVAFSAGG